MGFFDFSSERGGSYTITDATRAKARRKAKRVVVGTGRAIRKPLTRYTPAYGTETRTLAGTKLTAKQKRYLQKVKAKRRKKNKRIIRKIWRKLI